MRIKIANANDAVAAANVLRRSIAQLCIADHQNDERFLAGWLANKTPENVASWIANSPVFVAEDGGAIVGVATLTNAGDVTLNYVAPEARFKGVSKALLRAVENRAMELGCDFCTLKSTKTALRFYKAAGYRQEGDLSERMLRKPLADLQATDCIRKA